MEYELQQHEIMQARVELENWLRRTCNANTLTGMVLGHYMVERYAILTECLVSGNNRDAFLLLRVIDNVKRCPTGTIDKMLTYLRGLLRTYDRIEDHHERLTLKLEVQFLVKELEIYKGGRF